jgi:hypothetical protein
VCVFELVCCRHIESKKFGSFLKKKNVADIMIDYVAKNNGRMIDNLYKEVILLDKTSNQGFLDR